MKKSVLIIALIFLVTFGGFAAGRSAAVSLPVSENSELPFSAPGLSESPEKQTFSRKDLRKIRKELRKKHNKKRRREFFLGGLGSLLFSLIFLPVVILAVIIPALIIGVAGLATALALILVL